MTGAIMGRLLALGVSAGLLAGACSSTGAAQPPPGAGIAPAAIDCSSHQRSDEPLVFHAMDPNVAPSLPASRIVTGAGVKIAINVGRLGAYRVIQPVPLECVDLQVSPSDAARISQDGSAIEIGEDVQPGSEILLTGTISGGSGPGGSETLRILIIDEVSRRLIATWSFEEARGCDGAEVDPPREIRFEASNGLSVAWTPFELYWDYWGRYGWEPDTGAFSFTATGGNQVASGISSGGQLALEGEGRLTLSGFDFGRRERGAPAISVSAADAGCVLVFRRQGSGLQ
jgi:hypothetical protein